MLAAIISLSAPFVLWPIEQFFPYPHIIEELLKLVLVLYILKSVKKSQQIRVIILSGLLFAFSESVFYFANILAKSNMAGLVTRFLLTGALHTITLLTIYFLTRKSKKLAPLGLFGSIVLHFLYNQSVTNSTL